MTQDCVQMAWRHGYGKMSDYYVNRKNKGMSQDTNEGAMRMDNPFVQMLANKIKSPKRTRQVRIRQQQTVGKDVQINYR